MATFHLKNDVFSAFHLVELPGVPKKTGHCLMCNVIAIKAIYRNEIKVIAFRKD